MLYEIKPFFIKTKTNLLVGEGSTTYDVVDNAVQRDSISHLPVINASSLKGALKDHMSKLKVPKAETINELEEDAYNKLFGSDDKQQGIVKFLDSYLIFLPLRSNVKPFFHTTSRQNLLQFVEFLENLGCKSEKLSKAKEFIENLDENENIVINAKDAIVEEYECKNKNIDVNDLLAIFPDNVKPKNIAILSDENFIDAMQHLPVIARNKLNNGKSENLWYEEVVPRESIFYTAMLDYNNLGTSAEYKYKKGFEAFYNILQRDLVQVGSNASIGYGLCNFYAFTDCEGEKDEK